MAPIRDALVIATFEEVTSDFGAVTHRVNERFGTRFREFEHTEANVEQVFALIDERAEGPPWQPFLNRFVSGLLSLDEYRAATERPRRSALPRHARRPRLGAQGPGQGVPCRAPGAGAAGARSIAARPPRSGG